jgi:O-antigen ligase
VTERIPRSVLAGVAVLVPLMLAYLAYSRPGYFTSQTYIGGILVLQLVIAAVCFYRRIFLLVVIVSFLLAGVDLPVGFGWTTARWIFLGAGAAVGALLVLKEQNQRFGLFHAIAGLTVLAAFISAAVSRYPSFALLKASSLFLLFVYAATGARLAVAGRENRFFNGLLLGCEIFVAVIAAFHVVGIEAMGNPNSLGAVMGVVGAPILLWGVMLEDKLPVRRRRLILYLICLYLLFLSHSRASIGAAALSFGVLALSLRKYRLLALGLVAVFLLAGVIAIFQPEFFSRKVESLTTDVVYKGGDRERGMLASRTSPWQAAVETIQNHIWFGTGFGTTDMGGDASEHLGRLASSSDINTENGSSYLAVTSWVGMAGVVPFLFLLLALLVKVMRTLAWMFRTRSPLHPAVPLAIVAVAGLLDAGFEDWLFAPGYYLCVFFWSMAFILVDVAPAAPSAAVAFAWRPRVASRSLGGAAPSP